MGNAHEETTMTPTKIRDAVDTRYSAMAETPCCLSCGGAADLSGARAGEICVDLGSGQGGDVLKLAAIVGERGFVYGVDTSKGMIRRARRTADKMGVKNVEFVHALFEDIQLEDGVADLVISNCSINHAEDKPGVWAEIYRILKPGGRFVVSDIYSAEPVPEEYRTDPEAVAECWAGAVTKEIYLSTLDNTGFADISIIEESAPYDKGKIVVSSFTVAGTRPSGCRCQR
jgi:arsenite methyltransferase